MPRLEDVNLLMRTASLLAFLLFAFGFLFPEQTAGAVEFNRDIRPILSDNCFSCHGPDEASRKADLRLDREKDAKGFAILPGDPENSEALIRLLSEDPDDRMPPPKSHKSVTAEEIALIRQWIEQGATWEEHWAFLPPEKPAPPAEEPGRARNEIDHFVLARLAEEGLSPSPPADRRTLLRRVTLDLTGLPPTPAEVSAFLGDDSPAAYEAVVDRLLRSPRYGEHRARYWLDAARYADTHGLHLDNYREIWPYRDWVIKAFNRNQPFDRFTVEQLAGDLLPEPSTSQLVATGFNRCNVTTSEGGAIPEEFLVRYAVDRVNTTSTVWLGLTAGCAQCHDHKFDPITQRDYYQLFAYFNNTTQAGMDKNIPDTPPVIRLYPNEAAEQRHRELNRRLSEVQKQLVQTGKEAEPAFTNWLQSQDQAGPPLPAGLGKPFTVALRISAPEEPGRYPLAAQADPDGRGVHVTLDTVNEGVEVAFHGAPGEGVLRVQPIKKIKPGSRSFVVFTYDGKNHPHAVTAWVNGRLMTRNRFPYLEEDRLEGDFAPASDELRRQADESVLSSIEVFDRILTEEEIQELPNRSRVSALLAKPVEKLSPKERKLLRTWFLHSRHAPYRSLLARRSTLETERAQLLRQAPVTHVMQDKADSQPTAPILERGEYDKPSGEVVEPAVPAALPALLEKPEPNRLGLARWLVHPGHPLTARVTVNRIWQQFFGTGLVATPGDFGLQGENPSHPDLLDWLAVDFVEHGWDVKRLVRQIVLSATYRQSSRITPQGAKRDPRNRLLARGPRFRMDAEVLRDQALFVSGLLVEKQGGPPVRPYQPDGLWSPIGYENSNTVKFYRHYGHRLYRRSIYSFWKRTAPPPNLTAFDAPDRESCTVRRERTNTPLQALVLMNDVQYVEAARHFAERYLDEPSPVQTMAEALLARPFSDEELAIARTSLDEFARHYRSHPDEARALLETGDRPNSAEAAPTRLAALTLFANQLLNLDEAVVKR